MKSIKILIVILLFIVKSFAQSTKIETNRGIHYITNDIKYTITGTYTFNGTEPIVELNDGGVGFYQLHEQPKRAIIWGMECDEAGEPLFIKGFDNAAYTLWYQYITKLDSDNETNWTSVEFTIHFNTLKMFIKGERSKNYIEPRE
jgi:hypothetical protein